MKKHSMNIRVARKYGTKFASHGWGEQEVGDWLMEQGYRLDGLTAKRIRRAYLEQVNRG